MGFAEEMTNLGEHLISSFDNRVKDVKKCFAASHNLRRDAQSFLNQTRSEQKNMFRNLHHDLNKFTRNLADETHEMLKSCSHQRQEQAKKDHRERRNFCSDITDNVKNLSNKTHQFMKKCEQQREKLHDEFERGHRNWERAMKEKNRHMNTVHFQEYKEPSEPRKAKKAHAGRKRRRVTK